MGRVFSLEEIEDAKRVFESLCATLNVTPNRRGEVHYVCPRCNHEVVAGKYHFSFSFKGGRCFACGYVVGVKNLARKLGSPLYRNAPRSVKQKEIAPKPRYWKKDPARTLDAYLAALDRLTLWQQYKPVSIESVARFRLGVGVLTDNPCNHKRLIVPVFAHGEIVGFRGRLIHCDCAEREAAGKKRVCLPSCQCEKWLNAGGTANVLFNADALYEGCRIVVCENNVDAILYQQLCPDVVAVAPVMGASTWQEAWTERIAECRPQSVLVVYDNDYPGGFPNRETYQVMLAQWQAKHPNATPPDPNGKRVLDSLHGAGVRAEGYHWPRGTMPHMDLGTFIAGHIPTV
jgi:hypothetical protein